MAERDDFSERVKRILAERVGYRCCMPECRASTSGPHTEPEKRVSVGVAAHITAAAEGGPRYDPNLTAAARSAPENGIWMCQTHGTLVDRDEGRYSTVILRRWKERAEEEALRAIGKTATSIEEQVVIVPEVKPTAYTPENAVADMESAAEYIGQFFEKFDRESARQTERMAAAFLKLRQGPTTPAYEAGVREMADATRDFALQMEARSLEFHEASQRFRRAMEWFFSSEVLRRAGNERMQEHVRRTRSFDGRLNDLLADLAELRHVQSSFPSSMGGNLSHALELSRAAVANLLKEIMSAKAFLAWVMEHDPESS